MYFEDYEIGSKFVTSARTVTEADIVNFAGLSGDWFPLHTDEEYARKTVFKGRVAHGMLTLSIASGLLVRSGLVFPESLIAFYGMDKVRFTAPVRPGDTIRVEAEVVGKEERGPDAGIVTTKWTVKNQRDEVVAIAEAKILVKKKGGASLT